MRLVDDIDAVWRCDRAEFDALSQVANVIDAVVGRGVYLDDVQRPRRGDVAARVTLVAGFDVIAAAGAVQRLREKACHRRLSDAARPAEQISVVDSPVPEDVLEGAHDVGLANNVAEGLGAPSTGKRNVRH